MRVTITAEEIVINSLKNLKKEHQKDASLLIGCKISDIHYHILTCLSPPVTDNGSPKTSIWADQVSSTLPGGIHVLGLATAIDPKEIKNQLSLFGGTLKSVWKRSSCGLENDWISLGGCPHSLLLYYSPESRKVRCMTLDMNDSQSVLQFPGGEVKVFSQSLLKGQAFLSFSSTRIIVPSSHTMTQVLNDKVNDCLQSVKALLGVLTDSSVGVLLPSNSDSLAGLLSNHKDFIEVEFLKKVGKTEINSSSSPRVSHGGLTVELQDGVLCKAYVHSKSTWECLVQALKLDAIKSLTLRKNALMAELEDVKSQEEEKDESEKKNNPKSFKIMFPKRLWFSDNQLPFSLTDNCFPNETENEVKDNLISIWGKEFELIINDECEVTKLVDLVRTHSLRTNSLMSLFSGEEIKNNKKLYIIAALVVLTLAVVIFIIL